MKLNLNRVILYLLIIVFLVLVLQYVLAFLNLRASCNHKEGFGKKFKKLKKKAGKISKSTVKFASNRAESYIKDPSAALKDAKTVGNFVSNKATTYANDPSAALKDAKAISNATLGKSITNSAINYVNTGINPNVAAINYAKESLECKRKREELEKENKKLKDKLKDVQGMGAPVDENFANYY